MRSDRNPYFLLKKSKNPVIAQLLKDAETLPVAEIEKMSVKPDVKRAMLFVSRMGSQEKSNTTANLLADQMVSNSQPQDSQQFPMWQYLGEAKFVNCVGNGSVQIQPKDVFIQQQNQIFVQHIWCQLDHDILRQSQLLGEGTFSDLNIKIQEVLKERYHS